jgi:beta-lactamase superfamily II metal-dependent hydrolase
MTRFINDCEGKYTTPVRDDTDKVVGHMLWGDQVRTNGASSNGWTPVITGRSRLQDQTGWVPNACLSNDGLLEVYIIDVGQGDGVLLRTPDDKWHVVDAGVSSAAQMTKKGAANFIRWKFQTDLGRPGVDLEFVMMSHPDFDHYGGLIDLLSGRLYDGRTFPVSVKHFWHPGMARFASGERLGRTRDGQVSGIPFPHYGVPSEGSFITELLDKKADFANPPRPLDSAFADLARLVATVPNQAGRLDASHQFVPGYGAGNASGVEMKLLGPIVERIGSNAAGMRELGDESKTRNGHSIVVRLDYGRARLLLTGDLNTASQRLLLSYHASTEFAADVVKGCHHGSDDIDLRFVRAMAARSTVISSGDSEDYAHPRPRVMGASARYGRDSKSVKGEILPPLIYSTELARSVKLEYAQSIRKTGTARALLQAEDSDIRPVGGTYRPLGRTPLSTDLIYGLVNVRTDGERILCATMEERGEQFDIQVFRAGVEP